MLVVTAVSLQDNPPVTKCPGPAPCTPPPRILLLAICRSTDQTALSHGECEWLMEYGWWRSGLAPFNTASTSNNSRLWQLCIIHLVESLSPFPPWRFSLPSLLFQFLFSSSPFLFFSCLPALGEGERENQGSVPSDAACFPLTPVILETQKCLSAARCPDSEFWMPSEPDCVRSLSRLCA